jgi:hypothetical protein
MASLRLSIGKSNFAALNALQQRSYRVVVVFELSGTALQGKHDVMKQVN